MTSPQWTKLGRVFVPTGNLGWARSYACFPTPHAIGGGRVRVYFASLDEHRRGRVGYVEVDESRPAVVVGSTADPVLDLGPIGSFDDSGVNPFCVLDFRGRKLMYYQGWQRTERVPYLLFTGLAESFDGGRTFARTSAVPVLDRTPDEPFMRASPCALEDGGMLRIWYTSCARWEIVDGQPRYQVTIRHASSDDGVRWRADPVICLAPRLPDEYAVGRPWVMRDGNLYRMWFSARSVSQAYVIGYAESNDGLSWTRKDDLAGITKSPSGWDSQMICYPALYRLPDGRNLLFYNGNRHGESGFGCAESCATR